MTLILSCLTPDHLVQVSDRRLTTINPPGRLTDDHANKAICANLQWTYGYTGLAEINGEPTDLWLARRLSEYGNKGADSASRNLARVLSEEFKPLTQEWARLACVGVGWLTVGADPTVRPAYAQVSNFLDERGVPLREKLPHFVYYLRAMPDDDVWVRSAGANVPRPLIIEARRTVRRALEGGSRPAAVSRVLAELVLRMAARNPTIGRNLMVTSMPRAAVEARAGSDYAVAFLDSPKPSDVTFSYHDGGSETGIAFAPIVIWGTEMLTGIRGA